MEAINMKLINLKKIILQGIKMFVICLVVVGCWQNQREWEKASKRNTVDSYREFIQKHPRSEFSQQALTELEKLSRFDDWNQAQKESTIFAYEDFLTKHPNAEFAMQARSILDGMYINRDWEKAKSINSIEAYEIFLLHYSTGNISEEAYSRLKSLRCKMNIERFALEESLLPIPKRASHTFEEVMSMLDQRINFRNKLESSLKNDSITKEQYDSLEKISFKHGLGDVR